MMEFIGLICAAVAIGCSGYGAYLLIKDDQAISKKDKILTALGVAAMIAVLILAAVGAVEILMPR